MAPQPGERAVVRRRPVASLRRRDGLIRYARDVTSQNGEDGILAKLFELLLLSSSERRKRDDDCYFCVDIGAWDGKHLSNTYSLLCPPNDDAVTNDDEKNGNNNNKDDPQQLDMKWKGLLIEADPERFKELQALHQPLGNTCINAAVSCQPSSPQSLVALLSLSSSETLSSSSAVVPTQQQQQQEQEPVIIDFLCIDVDGIDYWLLHQVYESPRYRPIVVCVEFNPTMPNDLIYIPPRNDVTREGASLAALVELSKQFGYVLVETTLYNAFFIPQSHYNNNDAIQEMVPDTSIEALHQVTMGTQLYQLYDGTLRVWGCKKLLWHRQPIQEDKLQMLSKAERVFPFAPNPNNNNNHSTTTTTTAVMDASLAVNLSSYRRNSSSTSSAAAKSSPEALQQLSRQLQETGFCWVRGTGVAGPVCRKALRLCHEFLHTAPEDVRRSTLTRDRARRGYSPMCTENFASLVGQNGPHDLVRKFRMGPPEAKGESSLLQPNVWPTPSWDQREEFQTTLQDYYQQICQAAETIVQAICDTVGNNNNNKNNLLSSLSSSSSTHTSILTLLGYRVGSRHKRRPPTPLVAPHTDVGVVTILVFDAGDCAVLQRYSESQGDWIDVTLPPSDDDDNVVFVVNIGDCLAELTGLPSTLHRVMPRPQGKTPRNCLALFVGLDPLHQLQLPSGDTITYQEWRKKRIARAQSVLSSKTTA